MAEHHDDRPGRGLFGLGGRRATAPGPAAPVARPGAAPRRGSAAAESQDHAAQLASLNLKALAGMAVRQMSAGPVRPTLPLLDLAGLQSRPVHYDDIGSPWFAYWAGQLADTPRAHRKLWEFAAILQALYEAGALVSGARALGFGVGDEPLPSYLAHLGLQVVATDLPGEAERERIFKLALVNADTFDANVEVSNLDMRRLDDATLRGFDICWSSSVITQFSGMGEAADAVIGAMDVLRPGGVAVHTADLAFADDMPFSPIGDMSYSRSFFEKVAEQLAGRGHEVVPLSFDLGDHPLDGYVDLEPFVVDGAEAWARLWSQRTDTPHLKLFTGGVLKTSFVFIVRARSAPTS